MNAWLLSHVHVFWVLLPLCGGLGALCRWGLDGLVRAVVPKLPEAGIIVVNTLAVFAICFSVVAFANFAGLALITTGFLGGFSTFSTHVFQAGAAWLEGRFVKAGALLLGGWGAGLAAAAGGFYLAWALVQG